jgi:hypothetical protein
MDIKRGNEINVGWNSHDARALDPKSIWDWFNQKILILNNNYPKSEVDLIFVNCCNKKIINV